MLKHVEEDIEQVLLESEILVGNEGNQMQIAVFTGTSCDLEDLRFDDTVGIVPNPLMIQVECAEYRQEVSIQALHDQQISDGLFGFVDWESFLRSVSL